MVEFPTLRLNESYYGNLRLALIRLNLLMREKLILLKRWAFTHKVLLIIFFLALLLRLYQLGDLPHGFYEEEMTNAYVGKFIFLHGKDLYGNPWPLLYFDKFGDYPPVIPLYISGIGTLLFGTTVFGARFSIALIGALTVFPLYLLSQLIFKNKAVSLFCAFILAILPWHVVLSRTSAEGVIGLAAYTYGLYFILKGSLDKKTTLLYIGSFFLFACYFLYPGLRILVPLSLVPLPFLFTQKKKILYILVAVSFLLTLIIARTDWGSGRFKQTSLFSSPEVAASVKLRNENLSHEDGHNNVLESRIFHNKLTGYFREFAYQYLSYFSPRYLFLEAGGQPRYYNVRDQGLLYLSLLPLFLLCLLPNTREENKAGILYIMYLLVITPLPAALTVDFPPHAHWSMFMILPLVVMCAYGLYKIYHVKYRNAILIAILLMLSGEFVYFWHQYSVHADQFQSVLRNDGDREFSLYIKDNRSHYQRVFMPVFERLPLYYLFFTDNFDYSLAGKFRKGLLIDSVDNITFVGDSCPSHRLKPDMVPINSLVVDDANSCTGTNGFKELTTMKRIDGTSSYRLLVP